jgi:hypothetical protein
MIASALPEPVAGRLSALFASHGPGCLLEVDDLTGERGAAFSFKAAMA